MMDPPIEVLMEKVGSKFGLVALAAKRGRQINSYYNQLGEGLGAIVPPQVTSVARKPLSIAFEEVAADKIVPVWESAVDLEEAGEEVAPALEPVPAQSVEVDGSGEESGAVEDAVPDEAS